MGPKLLKRISKLIQNNRNSRSVDTSGSHDGQLSLPDKVRKTTWWDSKYSWNIDDEDDIPGTVRIALSSVDPQAGKNLVVCSVLDRCFIPGSSTESCIEIFSFPSSSVLKDSNQLGLARLTAEVFEKQFKDFESPSPIVEEENVDEERPGTLDTETETGENEENAAKNYKRINHFSFCDRATQTTILASQEEQVQTEAPSRVTFSAMTNAWIVSDAYIQDQLLQQRALQENVTNSFQVQPGNEILLSEDGFSRLKKAAHTVERMLNQNTYDDIAQDFKYWEDAADEYREPEGTLLPLWRFTAPPYLLRMFHDDGNVSNVPNHVSCLAWNMHYKDLFAMGLGSRNNMTSEAGLVCIFSLKSPAHPERHARMSSGVSSIDFHPEFWQLLAVALHDGHVAVVDLSASSEERKQALDVTVYRSSALRGKRTVPMTQVIWAPHTAEGNLRLITTSADGCVCSWVFTHGELYPTELVTLPYNGPLNEIDSSPLDSFNLNASCSCIALNPSSQLLLVGTEEGQLVLCSLDGKLEKWGPVEAHHGSVYSVQWNPFHAEVFLTCGADWFVKIWHIREEEPLIIVDAGSAVEDACWSPFSSTVISCVTEAGKVMVFDFSARLHKPLCSQRVAPQRKAKPTRITFCPHHPVFLVGDDRGHATCLKLSPNLRKISKVPDSMRQIDVEIAKLERLIILMKKPEDVDIPTTKS